MFFIIKALSKPGVFLFVFNKKNINTFTNNIEAFASSAMVWNPFYTFLRYKEIRLFQNKILIYTSKHFDHHFNTNMIVKTDSTSIIFTFKIINEAASYCLRRSLSPFKFISANTCSSESTDTHLQRICTFPFCIIS